jgi:hypothetical protein
LATGNRQLAIGIGIGIDIDIDNSAYLDCPLGFPNPFFRIRSPSSIPAFRLPYSPMSDFRCPIVLTSWSLTRIE